MRRAGGQESPPTATSEAGKRSAVAAKHHSCLSRRFLGNHRSQPHPSKKGLDAGNTTVRKLAPPPQNMNFLLQGRGLCWKRKRGLAPIIPTKQEAQLERPPVHVSIQDLTPFLC